MNARGLVIAGTASGVGKTTITLGLLEALRRRGLVVQPFKVGPDFIDPGFHSLVAGRPSQNLDGWMCGRDWVRATVARYAAGADLALIEGVMGCFDGFDATGEDGSTAQVAKWLGAPVALVVDASSQARSVAAVVQGFERFDPDLGIVAVIANRVGSEAHAALLREAIRASCRAALVGALSHDERLALPERHLGLVTAIEGALTPERRARLADAIEASIDLDRLLALASPLSSAGLARAKLGVSGAPGAPDVDGSAGLARAKLGVSGARGAPDVGRSAGSRQRSPRGSFGGGSALSGGKSKGGRRGPLRPKIGVAHDAAFQFYYPHNLDLLRAAGAELISWSPLDDAGLPDVDGLYFGGGYPELYARRLSDNAPILKAVAQHAGADKPIYAECGGLMYLAQTLEDMEGVAHRMVGLLPTAVHMLPRRLTLGYTEVCFSGSCPLGSAGQVARGHEFHYSTLAAVPASVTRVYHLRARRGQERAEGYLIGRALLSYVHLHFGSNPALADAFVSSCARARGARAC